MIVKSSENTKLKKNNFYLLYGKNEGFKNEILDNFLKDKKNIFYYDEKEVLEKKNEFIENNLSNSLFENEKIILIKRATDKILETIKEISEKNIIDITIIIISENLEKKSKLRSFFEKNKTYACIPFYEDNDYTLLRFANLYLQKEKIKISQENMNYIISKSNGDRGYLKNNLKKLSLYSNNNKIINNESLFKLINLTEEKNISVLIDNCLAKNQKKIINILNENNFTNDDCIIIVRTLLKKSKHILLLSSEYEKNKDIGLTISSSRPPIFWKDKEITKKQILEWPPTSMKKAIYETSKLELNIKKNFNNSINLITDFLISFSSKTNNLI